MCTVSSTQRPSSTRKEGLQRRLLGRPLELNRKVEGYSVNGVLLDGCAKSGLSLSELRTLL
jgi:hypothetical protein